jgi:hypothetical protein
MVKEILDAWAKLTVPSKVNEFSYYAVEGTNIMLTKNNDGLFGIIIYNTNQIPKYFKLKNFIFLYKDKLETPKGEILQRCQLVFTNRSINDEYLIKILFSIITDLQMPYSSAALVSLLTELGNIFDPEVQNKNEIIGVWGELYLINDLIEKAVSTKTKESIINSWEGDVDRKKIDFRFIDKQIAIEAKTTINELREHHFSGTEQFIKPLGFKGLYFASIRLIDDDGGFSCYDLVSSVMYKLNDSSLIRLFDNKILLRGNKICNDNYYRFSPRDNYVYLFYNSEDIETPNCPKGVSELRWTQNIDLYEPLKTEEVQNIFFALIN